MEIFNWNKIKCFKNPLGRQGSSNRQLYVHQQTSLLRAHLMAGRSPRHLDGCRIAKGGTV